MSKKRLPRPTEDSMPWKKDPPPDAVWYHGYQLDPEALKRFMDVEEYHLVHGKEGSYSPDWRKKDEDR